MTAILLPIKPIYVGRLLNGTKKYEYRKRMPKQDIKEIYIYSTSPEMRIVGVAKVISTLEASPSSLWEKTKGHAGISRERYRTYFKGCRSAYAYEIGEVLPLPTALKLIDLGINFVPQSFMYLDQNKNKNLLMRIKNY